MTGKPGKLRDYCIPVNSYFPNAEMLSELQQSVTRAIRYYPSSNQQVAVTVAKCFHLDPATVVMFNGATEALTWIDQLLLKGTIVTPVPTFGRWTDVPRASGKHVVYYQRRGDSDFQIEGGNLLRFVRRHGAGVLIVSNPNNPTGAYIRKDDLVRMLDALQDMSLIVVDESFIDFSDADQSPSVAIEAASRDNVIVIKSLGKNLGLHGIRLGYSVSNPGIASMLRAHVPFWNINAVAESVLQLLPEHLPQYDHSRKAVVRDRYYLEQALRTLPGFIVYPSQANFVFCRIPAGFDGDQMRNNLLTEFGFLVRHCGNKVGSDSNFFRIVARPRRDSRELIEAIKAVLPNAAEGRNLERGRYGASTTAGYT